MPKLVGMKAARSPKPVGTESAASALDRYRILRSPEPPCPRVVSGGHGVWMGRALISSPVVRIRPAVTMATEGFDVFIDKHPVSCCGNGTQRRIERCQHSFPNDVEFVAIYLQAEDEIVSNALAGNDPASARSQR